MSSLPRQRATALTLVLALVAALVVVGGYVVVDGLRSDSGSGAAASATSSPVPAPSDATGGLAVYYRQHIDWKGCAGTVAQAPSSAQCGTLRVPVDYAAPNGKSIKLALLRVPAKDQDERLGSLVVNPGGPGASGVEYAAGANSIVTEDVRNRYDVVGFDPRGVGRSAPIDCLTDRELDAYLASDPVPTGTAQTERFLQEQKAFAQACARRTGALLAHVGTVDVARDVDVLRGALGDTRLTYLGKSYGTAIGAEYARQFPTRVGRMVLDGVVDPAQTATELALGQAVGFQRALTAFLTWCVKNNCPLGVDVPTAEKRLQQLLDDLDTTPLPTGDANRPLTQSLALFGIALPLYVPASQGYPPLKAALEAALEGKGQPLLQLSDAYFDRRSDGSYNGNQNEAISAVSCLDRRDPGGAAAVQRSLPRFESASPIFGEFIAWSAVLCDVWPEPATSRAAPVHAPGAPPIVVIGTTGDPATPYEASTRLADELDSGVLVTYEGAGHTAYGKTSSCVDSAVDGYLIEGRVPEDGLRCS